MPKYHANPAGGYVLFLRLDHPQGIQVGKLGEFYFAAGYFLYFGSALNGLAGRIRRHRSTDKKIHWHIDYLTASARVEQVWWAAGRERWECLWAQAALLIPEMAVPAPRFGASDCRCSSHLFQARSRQAALSLRGKLPENPQAWRLEGLE